MSWLSGYKYRVKIPCTATNAGAETIYTKLLTIVKSSGSNSAGTVYLQDHTQNWPNDIRFTKSVEHPSWIITEKSMIQRMEPV